MKTTDRPHKWVILKIKYGDGYFYRVFASWSGGYAGSDTWKTNSGITDIEEDETHYHFHGKSGSCYSCRKTDYGVITNYNEGILMEILKNENVTLLPEDTDFKNLLKNMEKQHLEPNLTKDWAEFEYRHNRPDETPNSYEIGLPSWGGIRDEKKGLGFAYRTDGKWSINGRIVTEPEKILEGIENYFKNN